MAAKFLQRNPLKLILPMAVTLESLEFSSNRKITLYLKIFS